MSALAIFNTLRQRVLPIIRGNQFKLRSFYQLSGNEKWSAGANFLNIIGVNKIIQLLNLTNTYFVSNDINNIKFLIDFINNCGNNGKTAGNFVNTLDASIFLVRNQREATFFENFFEFLFFLGESESAVFVKESGNI